MEKFFPDKLEEKTVEYFISHIAGQDTLFEKIKNKALELNMKNISVSPFDAAVISTITMLAKPKRAVEIGCFLGYSAIKIATSMPDDGKLYTIEKNDISAQAAMDIIKEEGLSNKIIVINKQAQEALAKLSKISKFDMCLIDADKEEYPFYLKWALKNLKSNGVIIAHNPFLKGKLFYDGDDKEQNKKSRAMREFLYDFFSDENLISRAVIPTPDGLVVGIVK